MHTSWRTIGVWKSGEGTSSSGKSTSYPEWVPIGKEVAAIAALPLTPPLQLSMLYGSTYKGSWTASHSRIADEENFCTVEENWLCNFLRLWRLTTRGKKLYGLRQ